MIANGNKFTLRVDGEVVSAFQDSKQKFSQGSIRLGFYGGKFEIRKIEIKELTPIDAARQLGVELLKNPGCEEPLVDGKIPGWTGMSGNWQPRLDNPPPQEGRAYFFAGAGRRGELTQEVSIQQYAAGVSDGTVTFAFTGYTRSFDSGGDPPDRAQLLIEYVGANDKFLGVAYDSGQTDETQKWVIHEPVLKPPVGTQIIRLRLVSIRRSQVNNDSYFDGLSLKAVSR